MGMSDFHKLFEGFGLNRIAEQLEKLPRNSLRLAASARSKHPVGRLGGRPNLPAGTDWPTADGPMAFLAQFDLSSLPPVEDLALPTSGALFFFCGPGKKDSFRVVYSERPLAESAQRGYPKDLAAKFRLKALEFTAREEISLPWPEDVAIEQLGLSKEEIQAWWKVNGHWLESLGDPPSLHRIGGYPNYIQHDPKFEAYLKSNNLWTGIWAKEPGASARDHFAVTNQRFSEIKARLKPESADWKLLLQLDSEESAPMPWGDMPRHYFVIRDQDLRARQFDRAWMIWDCY